MTLKDDEIASLQKNLEEERHNLKFKENMIQSLRKSLRKTQMICDRYAEELEAASVERRELLKLKKYDGYAEELETARAEREELLKLKENVMKLENRTDVPLKFRILFGKAENPQPIVGTFEKLADKRQLFLARKAARKKKWAKAEKYYADMLKRYLNRPRILVQYGHVLKEQGLHDAAFAAYAQALKLDPGNGELQQHVEHLRHLRS
ncbi:hypothetical protein CFR73_13155 [Novacetimonas maltaceti]|uniref:Uncharacterized protein n=1 Tax=Novacetimonas maltaceti TaxID=1203393 RepID=A0A2S3W0E0_9PROT|nr:hypothetical protein [Novacetimonas maltaceti]POF62013.1 hypothetical protein KMAL_23510 [Novacetimonas maltaceti]PYD59140.1 hypothetical protein CFR73_13155 [Novacetimonas maltaceti]